MGCLESQALTLFVRRFGVIASDSVIAKPEGLKQSLDCFVALLLSVQVPVKNPFVYILTNKPRGTLYVGVTSDLVKRIWQHKNNVFEGFSSKYHLHTLVWFEQHASMEAAILREKQIKGGSRQKKIALIDTLNPQWLDLYEKLL